MHPVNLASLVPVGGQRIVMAFTLALLAVVGTAAWRRSRSQSQVYPSLPGKPFEWAKSRSHQDSGLSRWTAKRKWTKAFGAQIDSVRVSTSTTNSIRMAIHLVESVRYASNDVSGHSKSRRRHQSNVRGFRVNRAEPRGRPRGLSQDVVPEIERDGSGFAAPAKAVWVEPARQRKIIHIDMDAFYASVEQRDNPELRGKPVAVGGSRERGVVAAASYEARRFGVRSAMPSVTAKRRCPELIFVKPRFDVYRAVSHQIREIFADVHAAHRAALAR